MRPLNFVGSHVVDKTGLTGTYDFTLYYSPMSDQQPGPDAGPPVEVAVQQQLGLKLTPAKTALDVIVVDEAEKMPTEN